mmetsp:Transcript_64300/g.182586  ORF Transcript_64300/g.182586 Transcript_64300/m.182586 type:complete len:330 (-) Transcript_64300:59-1048(-)
MAEEESVLGISIGDPEVLKATQFVLTSVGISAFFLVLELVTIIDDRGLHSLDRNEAIWWAVDTARAVIMTGSGYFGVRRSSRLLLGCFCTICAFSVAASLIGAVADILHGQKAGIVVLRAFASLFFAVGGYFSSFLFRQAGEGTLLGQRGGVKSSYVLLGMPMMDLQVLKATQSLLTSLGIAVCLLGSFIIVGAEGAVGHGALLGAWLFSLGVVVSMSYTAICGVRRSSAALLGCFCCITGFLSLFFGSVTIVTAMACGKHCLAALSFDLFVVLVFGTAFRSGRTLKQKVTDGVSLTAVPRDEVPPVPIGACAPGAAAEVEMDNTVENT